jgi:hypothetical protein
MVIPFSNMELRDLGDWIGNFFRLEPVVQGCVCMVPVVPGLLIIQNLRTHSWSDHP